MMLRRIENKARRETRNGLLRLVSKRVDFDPSENVYLFSDPRGGSTWLTELLAGIDKTAVLWEPLHLDYLPGLRQLGFGWRQVVPENAQWPEFEALLDQVLSGKQLNHNLAHLNTPMDYLKAERLIVKFCRGNGLLPWMVRRYSFKYKPILLLRHPFAVAASQLRQGGWNYSFTGFEIPDQPYNDVYHAHKAFLKSLKTKEEALVASWCLMNAPLIHDNRGKWITVYYERLFLNPGEEIQRIFSEWSLEVPAGSLGSAVRRPSVTTVDLPSEDQLQKWQGRFSQDQILAMLAVLEYFGVKVYTGHHLPAHTNG